ncbi:MAG: heme-binding domain-containing protein [Bacteroidota bacterium]
MGKYLKWAGIILAAAFVGIQFVPVERTNPPVDPEMTFQVKVRVPPEIDRIIRRSCYDCHSHETKWPWYAYIAPSSWLVTGDVTNGRSLLNFSNWSYNMFRTVGRLDQMAQEVYDRKMPLPPYLMMHPGAKLSEAEKDALIDWVEVAREEIMNPPEEPNTTTKKK